ncbi:rod-binding protein [Cereibacter sphaeroides]|uniref:rod-binding protein n=1 Tax=Cereibacter sphaeroides TaxID=1063 RepID=UPI001F1E13AA|nr:rod-binding protein [Cereibacter sphaeroides]MCE6961896.1 rod-binding protein [Cereibacter sphaeroides]MCE6975733.1 rod-binding protein [Cereibacter sphaeroides]
MDVKLHPLSPLSLAGSRPEPQGREDLRQAAQGFESLFVTELLKAGRAGLPGDDLLGSAGVDTARDMLDMELARSSAARTGFGIADAIERQFAPFVKGS